MLARTRITQQEQVITTQKHEWERPVRVTTTSPYRAHLPLLFLSFISYTVVVYMLMTIQPASIAHFPLPYTYLPLQLPFFLGNFFLFSYLFLKTRRGFLIASGLSTILFLKLQLVLVTPLLVAAVVGTLLLTEVALSTLFKRTKQ